MSNNVLKNMTTILSMTSLSYDAKKSLEPVEYLPEHVGSCSHKHPQWGAISPTAVLGKKNGPHSTWRGGVHRVSHGIPECLTPFWTEHSKTFQH